MNWIPVGAPTRHSAVRCRRREALQPPAQRGLEDHQHPGLHAVRAHGRPGRAAHPQVEHVDERVREHDVDDVREHGRHHGRARVALAVADLTERHVAEDDGRAQHADAQVRACRLTRGRCGRHVREQLRHALPHRHGDETQPDRRQQRRAQVGVGLVLLPAPTACRNQALGRPHEAEREEIRRNAVAPASPTPAICPAPRRPTSKVSVRVMTLYDRVETVIGQAMRKSSRTGLCSQRTLHLRASRHLRRPSPGAENKNRGSFWGPRQVVWLLTD